MNQKGKRVLKCSINSSVQKVCWIFYTAANKKHAANKQTTCHTAHRFSWSSLGTSHKIPSSKYDGNTMLLNRGRFHISWLCKVSAKSLTELCFFKCLRKGTIKERERVKGKKKKKTSQRRKEEMKIPTHHDCFGGVASTYIHKDVIILIKVDTCCIVSKNGVLFLWWWRWYIADLGP